MRHPPLLYGLLMSGSLVVAICAVALATLSLGWQAATYVLTGGRVKVELLVGAMGNGGIVTAPPNGLSPDWQEHLATQGFSRPIVAVTVANVGRQPVKVDRWGIKSGVGTSFYPVGESIGPKLPHRLEVGDAGTWAVDLITLQAFIQATNEVAIKSQSSRGKSLIGLIIEETKRPKGPAVAGLVQLADGRTRLSKGVISLLPAPPRS